MPLNLAAPTIQAFTPVLDALKAHRSTLAQNPDVLAIRPGYRRDPAGAVTPALVISVTPSKTLDARALEAKLGVQVEVVEATPHEQLRTPSERTAMSELEIMLRGVPLEFAQPKRGSYQPPPNGPALETIEDRMDVSISASPDVGWTVLRDFLRQGVKKSLTIGIYQFTAPHIFKELMRTMRAAPNATLDICRQPKSEPIGEKGTKSDDMDGDDIIERLRRALGSRFDFVRASTGAGAAFTTSYHIKVAVADKKRFWLSSGNMQSSNQAPFDPIEEEDELPANYDKKYNREYHAVVEHPGLAKVFEAYLDHDRELPGVEAFSTTPEGPELVLPPQADEITFAPIARFLPLRLQDELVRVTPVLTPDNYAARVLPMLRSAKESISLQNQYITLNASGNLPEFEELVDTLLQKARDGVRVRILLRGDFFDFEKFDLLIAMGFDPMWFKTMTACHAKLIVVDRNQALLGSHNWSNGGTVTNRDASLLFEHEGIANYLANIFDHDWERRGRRPRTEAQPRVVRSGETFSGVTMPWASLYDESPRRPPVPAAPKLAPAAPAAEVVAFGAPGGAAKTASDEPDILPFGVSGNTGKRLFPPLKLKEIAKRIKDGGTPFTQSERALTQSRRGESFDLPLGTDPADLRTAGWAVLWGPNTPAAVRARLGALVAHRRGQMTARYFREIELKPGESVAEFLTRHQVSFGNQLTARLPYYLLIVGSPADVSYEFQYGLDLEYAVGRLWFDDEKGVPREDAFEAYAKAIVDFETNATGRRRKRIALWGPQHAGDRPTELSSTQLLRPLLTGSPDLDAIAARVGAETDAKLGKDATRANLQTLLTDANGAAVVLTAGHGMGFDPAEPEEQRKYQGALLCQDFTGFGSIDRRHFLAGEDLPKNASAEGLLAFIFACFGAGCPQLNTYPDQRGLGAQVAPTPFVAALPQALLERGALGVIGHIDIAFGFSFKPVENTPSQIVHFENVLGGVIAGERVGHATRSLNSRAMRLGTEIAETLMPGAAPADETMLVLRWLERNDARAYVLLGDPAAKLAFQ